MGDMLVPPVAAPLFRRLDQTRHSLIYAGDTDRPCQKQIRTRGRKREVRVAIDHPVVPGGAVCLYQDGSHAPGPAVKNGTNLETSPRHCPARDAPAVAPPGLQALLEIQVEGSFSQAKIILGDYLLDWGDGKGQSASSEQNGFVGTRSRWAFTCACRTIQKHMRAVRTTRPPGQN
jgi:hypothetical protein